MNDVELLTKNITIIVQLDDYDDKDFDVTIEAGDNKKRVCTFTNLMVREGTPKVFYQALNYFTLDNLKITCKYPVVVRCEDFIISKYFEARNN